MAFRDTLELILNADAQQGIAEVHRFASEAGKSVNTIESSFSKIGSKALKIGGAGMAAGGFLTAMADADVQSMKGLEAAISTTGHTVDEYQGRIDDSIDSMANFAHTDGEVTTSLNTLVSSYGDANLALDRMQLVADIAAKKHVSLADAASIVAKAHGGAGRIFKEFNITVGENADGTKNYEGALDELSKKVSGQASASVSGFTGHLRVLGAQVENFVSGLGEKFGPALLGVSTGLTALGGVTSGVGKLQEYLAARHLAAATAAETQAAAETGLVAAMGGTGGALLAAGAGVGIAIGLYSALGDALSSNERATDKYTQAIKSNTGSIQSNVDAVTAAELANNDAAKAANDAGISFGDQGRAVRQGTDDWGEYSRRLRETSSDVADTEAGHKILAQGLREAGAESTEFGRKLVEAAESGDLTRQQLVGLVEEMEGLHNGYTTAQGSASDLKSAQEGLNVATDEGTASIEEQKKALEDLNTAQQKDLDLANARIGGVIALSNAQIATRQSVADLDKATRDHTLSEDDHTKALLDAESAINTEAIAAGTLAGKQAEAAGATDVAAASTQAQRAEYEKILATLQPGSALYSAVQGYIALLYSTPEEISTNFKATGNINVQTGSIVVGGPGAPRQYALGGMVDGPVGKPQLAIVHGGEYVSTAEEVAAASRRGGLAPGASGGSQAITVPITLMLDERVLAQFTVDTLAKHPRRHGNTLEKAISRR